MPRYAAAIAGLTLVFAVFPPTASGCAPLAGADRLWAKPGLRFVLVGEMHGTTETPAAFFDLVCSAGSLKRPVIVGVERASREQALIDAFLAPQGHDAAVRALLSEKEWNVLDGRSSRAMLALLEDLRALKSKGLVAEVVAFDDRRSGETAAQREDRMASFLMAAAARQSGSLVIALTGNLHASKKSIARFGGYPFMAMLMPPTQTVSLIIHDLGGEAWLQQADDTCRPRKINTTGGADRGVVLSDGGPPLPGYDGVLSTGSTASASLPAIPDPPPQPACEKH